MRQRAGRPRVRRGWIVTLLPALLVVVLGTVVTLTVAADRGATQRAAARRAELARANGVVESIEHTMGERLAQLDIAASVIESTWPMSPEDFEQFIASYRLGTAFTDLSLSIVVEAAPPDRLVLMRIPRGERIDDRGLMGLDVTSLLPDFGLSREDLARDGLWVRPMGPARPVIEQLLGADVMSDSATVRAFTAVESLAVQRMSAPDTGATLGWLIVPTRLADLIEGLPATDLAAEVQLLDGTGDVLLDIGAAPSVIRPPLLTTDLELRGVPWRVTVRPTRAAALPASLDRAVLLRGGGATFVFALFAATWMVLRRRQRRLVRELGRASKLAITDYLTGQLNRSGLERVLEAALREPGRGPVHLLLLDADRFKLVNDNEGHQVGDDVLRAAAARLAAVVGPAGSLARFGGDEFVVVCTSLASITEAEELAARIHADFERPLVFGEGEHLLSVSIGISEAAPDEDATVGLMLSRADMAMYTAKRTAAGRTAVYDDAMRAEAARQLDVERELRIALREGQIVPYFQPIYTPDRELVAFEALARWEHPERGVLLPGQFLDIASQSGCLPELNRQILRRACELGVLWNARQGPRELSVLVNLAEELLLAPAFHADVRASLEQTGLPARLLTLEISEDTALSRLSPDLHELRRLSDLGIRLAIDDFGSGRSSLLALSDLDMVTVLKLDRAFVQKLPVHEPTRTVFLAVREIARGFGMHLVAEGVETEDEATQLVALGVDFVQGYLYGRPAPAHVATALVDAALDSAAAVDGPVTHWSVPAPATSPIS